MPIGVIDIRRLCDAVVIHLGSHFDAGFVDAYHAAHDVFDMLAQALFVSTAAFVDGSGNHRLPIVACTAGKQNTTFVNNGHVTRGQAFDG